MRRRDGCCNKTCLDAYQRRLGPDHPDTLTVIGQLAAVAQGEQANETRAEELFQKALDGRRQDFLSEQGRLEEAINMRRQALTALVEGNGEDDPKVRAAFNLLAIDLRDAAELHK